MKKIKYIALFVAVILVSACLLSGCSVLSNAAKLQEYDFDSDKIPTVNSVVGERQVTYVSTSISNGNDMKEYTYQSDSVFDDLLQYTQYLRENGWIVSVSYDLNNMPGSAQLGKQSADSGKILLLTIDYKSGEYTVTIIKGEGTLQLY